MLRAAVCRNLGSTWAARIRWSTSKVPTIDNIEILAGCPLFAGGLGAVLLGGSAARTAFEQPGATWAATIDRLDRELPRPPRSRPSRAWLPPSLGMSSPWRGSLELERGTGGAGALS